MKTEPLSSNYMNIKMKMLSLAALGAVAMLTTGQAAPAPAPVTNATVLNSVTAQFTVFSQKIFPQNQSRTITNHTGTLITGEAEQGALATKGILEALQAVTGDGFDANTAKLVEAKFYAETNVYTVVYEFTHPATTNYFTGSEWAGLSNEFELTIATNMVFTNVGSQLQVVDTTQVYPLTNNNFSFSFSAEVVTATEKATNGSPITGTTAGTESGLASLSVNAPSNWVFSVSGFGTATLSSQKLGVDTNKVPLYVDLRDSSASVYGSGYMGGTVTNGVPTNEIPVLLKGTLTETFWKVMINQPQ
jgi:hypothetical protein